MTQAGIKREMRKIAPGGFYLALRIGFAYPKEEINEFPEAWVERYTEESYVVLDPVVRWAFLHTGAKRYADFIIEGADGFEILVEAKSYGLEHGAGVSVTDDDSMEMRSYGSFARQDREFTDAELERLIELLMNYHRAEELQRPLTRNELAVLAMIKDGHRVKFIAAQIGVSEEAIRLRLKNARTKLGASSGAHAAALASARGLI